MVATLALDVSAFAGLREASAAVLAGSASLASLAPEAAAEVQTSDYCLILVNVSKYLHVSSYIMILIFLRSFAFDLIPLMLRVSMMSICGIGPRRAAHIPQVPGLALFANL